ncbi:MULTISPECIES: hypothetical protein [unclassified Paenibacillus]|uniref:hypothetical protein n=1 Tax=unclassified Paenibacillus TaxID=185978 RepID=UPI00362A351B
MSENKIASNLLIGHTQKGKATYAATIATGSIQNACLKTYSREVSLEWQVVRNFSASKST